MVCAFLTFVDFDAGGTVRLASNVRGGEMIRNLSQLGRCRRGSSSKKRGIAMLGPRTLQRGSARLCLREFLGRSAATQN